MVTLLKKHKGREVIFILNRIWQDTIRTRCATLCDKVCQWLATCRWFSPGLPVSPPIKLTTTI